MLTVESITHEPYENRFVVEVHLRNDEGEPFGNLNIRVPYDPDATYKQIGQSALARARELLAKLTR